MKPDRSEEISRPRVQDTYIEDWSSVPSSRYQGAQAAEKAWWTTQDPLVLVREAQYRFYAGHYEWITHRALLNPLCVNSSRPANFQIPSEAINGKTFLDIGCGPVPESLSLVHCAQVHVVDPLIGFFKQIQPYGWEFFSSVSASGAEQLSFEDQSVDFVLCRNTLDHTENADKVLVYDRPIGSDGIRWRDLQAWWMYSEQLTDEAEAEGKITLGGEFGGGETTNRWGVRHAYEGTLNVLRHYGLLDGEIRKIRPAGSPP